MPPRRITEQYPTDQCAHQIRVVMKNQSCSTAKFDETIVTWGDELFEQVTKTSLNDAHRRLGGRLSNS